MYTITVTVKNEKGETVFGAAIGADVALTGNGPADMQAVLAAIATQTQETAR